MAARRKLPPRDSRGRFVRRRTRTRPRALPPRDARGRFVSRAQAEREAAQRRGPATRTIWRVDRDDPQGGVLFFDAGDPGRMVFRGRPWPERYRAARRRARVTGTVEFRGAKVGTWSATLASNLSDAQIARALNDRAREIMDGHPKGSDVLLLVDRVALLLR